MTESNESYNVPIMMTLAILGGTGKEGSGLAMRWALQGYRVIIGSREAQKAENRSAELNETLGSDYITGMTNEQAAQEGNVVILTVPYSAHEATLRSVREPLKDKILVDVTVPIQPPAVGTVNLPKGQAAALEAREYLDESTRLVAAFQNVSAAKLKKPETDVNCDVLVCSDDEDAKTEVIKLIKAANMRGIDAGPLQNAIAVESLTPVLLHINKTYKVNGAGIRVTNLD